MDSLRQLPRARIVDILINGVMRPIVVGLDRDHIDDVARYLTEPSDDSPHN